MEADEGAHDTIDEERRRAEAYNGPHINSSGLSQSVGRILSSTTEESISKDERSKNRRVRGRTVLMHGGASLRNIKEE